jgi:hypothetical protein
MSAGRRNPANASPYASPRPGMAPLPEPASPRVPVYHPDRLDAVCCGRGQAQDMLGRAMPSHSVTSAIATNPPGSNMRVWRKAPQDLDRRCRSGAVARRRIYSLSGRIAVGNRLVHRSRTIANRLRKPCTRARAVARDLPLGQDSPAAKSRLGFWIGGRQVEDGRFRACLVSRLTC